jgi:hypothetical protein
VIFERLLEKSFLTAERAEKTRRVRRERQVQPHRTDPSSLTSELDLKLKAKSYRLKAASRFHPVLQDENRRHAVNGLASLFDRDLGFPQDSVGLAGGEPLVP